MAEKKKRPVFKKKTPPAPVVVKKPVRKQEPKQRPKEPVVSKEQREAEEAEKLLAKGVVEVTLPDGRRALQGPSASIVTGRLVKTRNQDGSAGKTQTVGTILWSHLGLTWAEIA